MREKILVLVFLFFFVYAGYGETYVSGDVSGVWEASGSPYYVTGELHVPTDDRLRIMPGCSVIFQGHYKFRVDSNAVLKAIGTETDSIIFTAENIVSGWWGIRFIHSSEACTLRYCRIQYGKALGDEDDTYGGGIYCDHSNPYISKNTITQNLAEWGASAIQQHRQGIPKSLLINVYPNPFNSACRVSAPPGATVEIFNILGNLVWSHTTAPSGSSEMVWTPDKSTGSGVYLVRATAGKQSATRKILYLK